MVIKTPHNVLLIRAKTINKVGKIISFEEHEAHSLVQGHNYLLSAQAQAAAGGVGPVNDTGGVARNLRNSSVPFSCNSGIGVTNYGVRIGTDNTPVAITDFALGAPIVEGGGAGQMNHQAVTFNFIGVAGNICSFEIERVIVNNSGGAINVQEAGIYGRGHFPAVPTVCYLCIARDLITQNVPHGGSITVTYVHRIVL